MNLLELALGALDRRSFSTTFQNLNNGAHAIRTQNRGQLRIEIADIYVLE